MMEVCANSKKNTYALLTYILNNEVYVTIIEKKRKRNGDVKKIFLCSRVYKTSKMDLSDVKQKVLNDYKYTKCEMLG